MYIFELIIYLHVDKEPNLIDLIHSDISNDQVIMSQPTLELYGFVIGVMIVLSSGLALVALGFICRICADVMSKRAGGRRGTIQVNCNDTTSGDPKTLIPLNTLGGHGRRNNGLNENNAKSDEQNDEVLGWKTNVFNITTMIFGEN